MLSTDPWAVLVLGVGLGLRHAMDADHVVVVSALVQREPGPWRAGRIAALWGLGHTAAFLGLGLLMVLVGFRVPPLFERVTETLVAVMLLGFGGWHLSALRRSSPVPDPETSRAKPVLIGLIHGLAGSASIGLLAATAIPSRALAVAYLVLFGLGTVLGMVALTVLLSRPLGWTMRREGNLRRTAQALAALLSLGLGAVLLIRGLLGE
jgi:hypothetical protein